MQVRRSGWDRKSCIDCSGGSGSSSGVSGEDFYIMCTTYKQNVRFQHHVVFVKKCNPHSRNLGFSIYDESALFFYINSEADF